MQKIMKTFIQPEFVTPQEAEDIVKNPRYFIIT